VTIARVAWLALLCAGCHAPFHTAPHTPLPTLDAHDGVVLDQPELVTITFPGYSHRAEVEAFGDFVGGSQWLKTVGTEYGVGPASQARKVVWPTAAPANLTDQELRMLLAQGITDGTLPAPPATGNRVVYLVYWPSTAVLDATSAGAGVVCLRGSFHSAGGLFTAGYHESAPTPAGGRVPYAVIGDCDDSIDEITSTASREIIGCGTNPYEVDLSGYLLDPKPGDPWLMNVDNGEAGYMCEREPLLHEGGYALHRSWSNAAATAGTQPCIPADAGEIYESVSASPASIVPATAGSTVSWTLTGWSTAETSDWTLRTARPDGSDFAIAELAPVLSRTTINNGKTVTLTMTVPATARAAEYGGLDLLSGDHDHVWPVAFVVK
jgi:hypothetical protein